MEYGRQLSRQRGFTLLEILIVIAILAIIASIGIPQYASALRNARFGKARHELVIMAEAIDSFIDNNDGHKPLTLYQVGFGGRRDPWGTPYCYLNYKDGTGDGLDWAVAAGIVDPSAVQGSGVTAVSHGSFFPLSPMVLGHARVPTRRPQGLLKGLTGVTAAAVAAATTTVTNVVATLTRPITATEKNSLVTAIATAPEMTFFTSVPTEETRRRDRYMFPLNTDYDLFSLGPNGRTSVSLGQELGQDDVIRANNGGYYGLASEY